MKAIANNRIFVTILVTISYIVFKPFVLLKNLILRWLTPKRQMCILSGLIGAVIIMIVVRLTLPEYRVVEVEVVTEVPVVQTVDARTIEAPVFSEEAANIARVLYGVKDYQLSDNAKLAIVETILSRVNCTYGEFGDTINEVCLKPLQWQGFVEGSDYLKEDYELALNRINDTSGARVSPEGCYWFVVSRDGVAVRSGFEESSNTWMIE